MRQQMMIVPRDWYWIWCKENDLILHLYPRSFSMSSISFIIKKSKNDFIQWYRLPYIKRRRGKRETRKKKKNRRKRINKNVTGHCIHSISMLYNNNLVDWLNLWIKITEPKQMSMIQHIDAFCGISKNSWCQNISQIKSFVGIIKEKRNRA